MSRMRNGEVIRLQEVRKAEKRLMHSVSRQGGKKAAFSGVV